MGLREVFRRKNRKDYDDLGGTPVSPSDKPKDTWELSRKMRELRLNGEFAPQDPNEIIGENPGVDFGTHFVKGSGKPSLEAIKDAKKAGKSITKTALFTGLGIALGGTIYLVSKEISNSKKKKIKKNKS